MLFSKLSPGWRNITEVKNISIHQHVTKFRLGVSMEQRFCTFSGKERFMTKKRNSTHPNISRMNNEKGSGSGSTNPSTILIIYNYDYTHSMDTIYF